MLRGDGGEAAEDNFPTIVRDEEMLALLFALAATPTMEKPWLIDRRDQMCAISAQFRDSSIVRIEYRPQHDSYLLLLSGGPYERAIHDKTYRVRVQSGRNFYDNVGKGIRLPGKPGTIYVALSDRRVPQRPTFDRQYMNAIEAILLGQQPMTIAIDGRTTARVDIGRSADALDSVAICSDKLVHASALVNRLQRARGLR